MKRQRLINGKWVDIPDEDKFTHTPFIPRQKAGFDEDAIDNTRKMKRENSLRKPDRKRKHTKAKTKRCKRK